MSTEILTVKLEALHTDVSEIKSALDKVSEAITKLALVEQQQNQIASSLERAFKAISKVEDRLVSLEKAQAESAPVQTETAKWVDRGVVALAGAGAVLVAKTLGIG
jgi:chromosome segregation ATPase